MQKIVARWILKKIAEKNLNTLIRIVETVFFFFNMKRNILFENYHGRFSAIFLHPYYINLLKMGNFFESVFVYIYAKMFGLLGIGFHFT